MTELQPIERLTRDLAKAAITLTPDEARYLVDAYYTMQANRIRTAGQIRAMNESGEPHEVIAWLNVQDEILENQIKRALDKWTDAQYMGRWAKAICGIGPVISAGLLAHIDITKAPTAGHIWRYAGLDPTLKWEKGKKRPFNASLKTLCAFKLGESFVKTQNNEHDIYGKFYVERKKLEQERNEALLFKGQAERILSDRKIDKKTDAYAWYSKGMLPPAQIHARARRYAVKLFLSHYHGEAYRHHFGTEPPLPYPIAHLGHVHLIQPVESVGK